MLEPQHRSCHFLPEHLENADSPLEQPFRLFRLLTINHHLHQRERCLPGLPHEAVREHDRALLLLDQRRGLLAAQSLLAQFHDLEVQVAPFQEMAETEEMAFAIGVLR